MLGDSPPGCAAILIGRDQDPDKMSKSPYCAWVSVKAKVLNVGVAEKI